MNTPYLHYFGDEREGQIYKLRRLAELETDRRVRGALTRVAEKIGKLGDGAWFEYEIEDGVERVEVVVGARDGA